MRRGKLSLDDFLGKKDEIVAYHVVYDFVKKYLKEHKLIKNLILHGKDGAVSRLDKKGSLKLDEPTKSKERKYKLETAKNINRNIASGKDNLKTIAYARVSSYNQKDDLMRQVQALELYCSKQGFGCEIIQDLGSGMDYYKKGLTKLLNLILQAQAKRLILTHKDRLLRFGAELVFAICEAKNVEVIIINKGDENIKFEE